MTDMATKCTLCLDDIVQDDAVHQALMCGCVFHIVCMDAFMAQARTTSVMDVKCPNCRHTADDVATLQHPPDSPLIDVDGDASMAGAGEEHAQDLQGEVETVDGETAGAQAAEDDDPAAAQDEPAAAQDEPAAAQDEPAAAHDEPAAAQDEPAAAHDRPAAINAPLARAITHAAGHVWPQDMKLCESCGSHVAVDKCRKIGKQPAERYRCLRCGCRMVQLHHAYGQWPTSKFENLSDTEKQDFFLQIGPCTTRTQVFAKSHEMLTRFESHSKFYAEGGEFLPLGVWATRGFDAARIERMADVSDIQEHAVLGTTYRVAILTTGSKGAKGTSRSEQISGSSDAGVGSAQDAVAGAAQGAPSAAQGSDGKPAHGKKRDSSSGSSASDSKAQARNKAKKDAKRKKKQAKLEKEKDAARKKAQKTKCEADKKRKKNAQLIRGKVEPVVQDISRNLAQPFALRLPTVVLEKAQAALRELDRILQQASEALANDSAPAPAVDMADLREKIKSAKKADVIVTSMISNIARLNEA